MPLMAYEYVLYVTFITSKIVLRHPNCDASKDVPTPTVSEFDEIQCASKISRYDSNGEIRFVIQGPENKFWIFDRNYNFVTKITIFAIFLEIGISRVLQNGFFFSSSGLGRDYTWVDLILGDQQHL